VTPKEWALESIQQLPPDVSWKDVVAALREAADTAEALRRYEERGGIPDEDLTDEEWMATIVRSLADELNDPRQDIYSPDDGTPS
jgi:hypothetical protein